MGNAHHPCISCDRLIGCSAVYKRTECDKLYKSTIEITDTDKEIIIEQMKTLFDNVSPQDSAEFIFRLLYTHSSGGMADRIMDELHKIIKQKHEGWLIK